MNPNSPDIDGFFEGVERPILINLQKRYKKGMVRFDNGNTMIVSIKDSLLDGIMVYDHVDLTYSPVSHEWIVTNYYVNVEVAQEIEDSYKECA